MPQNIGAQVAGKMLHCIIPEKFVATLCEALQKVELNSTFRNGFFNLSLNVFGRYKALHWAMFRATCLALALRDKLLEKLHRLTAPLIVLLFVSNLTNTKKLMNLKNI